ncbi:MAG: TerB family tellurite resistance protein, partial [Flavobacteriia bacterium]|nr:TerB family tellurite resistance protein [Flavobacteriia bacterium]
DVYKRQAVDGHINQAELVVLNRFSNKLGISEQEYAEVMKKENKYPIDPASSAQARLERLYDLFKIVFADHNIDEEEAALVLKYAIGLGYSESDAQKLIKRSTEIFTGRFSFEEYQSLL